MFFWETVSRKPQCHKMGGHNFKCCKLKSSCICLVFCMIYVMWVNYCVHVTLTNFATWEQQLSIWIGDTLWGERRPAGLLAYHSNVRTCPQKMRLSLHESSKIVISSIFKPSKKKKKLNSLLTRRVAAAKNRQLDRWMVWRRTKFELKLKIWSAFHFRYLRFWAKGAPLVKCVLKAADRTGLGERHDIFLPFINTCSSMQEYSFH